MKKSNLICPIYRRLGKCLAYANGRCHKVHDPRYVIVCPKFLKGSCENEKCLLSHNVNFHKMPVCKYFLQGLCQKQRECLYLHKKMSDDTKLCAEFLRGYCPKADKVKLNFYFFAFLLNFLHFSLSSATSCMTSRHLSSATKRSSQSSESDRRKKQLKQLKKWRQFDTTSMIRDNQLTTCQNAANFNPCHLISLCSLKVFLLNRVVSKKKFFLTFCVTC
jgi:hypothetical protein